MGSAFDVFLESNIFLWFPNPESSRQYDKGCEVLDKIMGSFWEILDKTEGTLLEDNFQDLLHFDGNNFEIRLKLSFRDESSFLKFFNIFRTKLLVAISGGKSSLNYYDWYL